LVGPRDLIRLARRYRKLFGGGMRQVGVIAAGALYALEHHVERLAEDHAHAQLLAAAVRETEGLRLDPEQIDTNMVIFDVAPAVGGADGLVAALKLEGVLVAATGPSRIRAVTHLDVNEAQVRQAGHILKRVVQQLR
jgi:threonine aldolase